MAQRVEPDRSVEDPEEISQKRRIKEILERRRQTLEARDEARVSVLMGETDEEDALLYYRSQLESLVYDLWNLLHNLDTESKDGVYYLSEMEIGEVVIQPPDEMVEEVSEWADGIDPPSPQVEQIEGLDWYLNAPEKLRATFSINSFDPPIQKHESVERPLKWSEIDAGLKAALEFIHDAGVDADLVQEDMEGVATMQMIEEAFGE